MKLKIDGCLVNIHDTHSVTIDREGCVCISLNYPHHAADDTPSPPPSRRGLKRKRPCTSRALFTEDSPSPPAAKEAGTPCKADADAPPGPEDAERCESDGRASPASRDVKLFGADSDDEIFARRSTGAMADQEIGTYRVLRGMLMLVIAKGKAMWLYRPDETETSLDKMVDRVSETGSPDHVSDTDSDNASPCGVWAFSDYVVCDEDLRDSKPSDERPLCTHYVTTDASAKIVSIAALPPRYLDYVQSFTDPDVTSPVERTASAVYDNALWRGRTTTIQRDHLVELIENGTELTPKLGKSRPSCTVCDLKNHPASYSFGPFEVGSVCAEYIKLASQAYSANEATRQAVVPPDTFVKQWDLVTDALHGCAEVQSGDWKNRRRAVD